MKKHLLSFATAIGYRISSEYINNGGYFPKEPWGCEGQIYPSLIGISLIELYKVTKDDFFLRGIKAIIESNITKQSSSGGWPLYIGLNGNGVKFHVSDEIIKITSIVEDLPPTAAAIRLIAEYQLITEDRSYSKSLEKAFSYLRTFWNSESGVFDEMLKGDALKLRASPKDYHIYVYQCVESLQKIYPEVEEYSKPLYLSVKQNFEQMNADTYPLLYGMHAALIAKTEGQSEYVKTVVKERILEEIAIKSRFLIPGLPGALGHHDGLRGICLDEGHLRNAIGAALAMDFYENATSTDIFSCSDSYTEITNWIQSMYDDGKYFEYVDVKSRMKFGDGSAGYFLPLFWILECF